MVLKFSTIIIGLSISPFNSFNLCFMYFVDLFSSVAQSGPTLCDPMDCSTIGFPVHQQLPKLGKTHVHRVSVDLLISLYILRMCYILLINWPFYIIKCKILLLATCIKFIFSEISRVTQTLLRLSFAQNIIVMLLILACCWSLKFYSV